MSTKHLFPKMDDEEEVVLTWSGVVVLGGVLFWVMSHICALSEWWDLLSIVLMSLGTGGVASAYGQYIQRRIRERKEEEFYSKFVGPWKREFMIQYPYDKVERKILSECHGLPITVTYEGDRTLLMNVRYDSSRGRALGRVVFATEFGHIADGSYVYIEGLLHMPDDNEGFAHSGRYSVHLFPEVDPDVCRVYYDGLMPDHRARGYEIWKRVPKGQPIIPSTS